MSDLPLDAILGNHRVVPSPAALVEVPPPSDAVSPPVSIPSEEHVRAVDGAFLRERQEQETIASLIGLRLSVLLMHDLARDAAQPGEEEEGPKREPEGESPQPAAD